MEDTDCIRPVGLDLGGAEAACDMKMASTSSGGSEGPKGRGREKGKGRDIKSIVSKIVSHCRGIAFMGRRVDGA